ncbi:hypothetical protein [Nostoc sp.]|uniref:hypothetical protein n=1 Tax=Nostoc sp. TaxID=1180 RepID=UPI002FF7E298
MLIKLIYEKVRRPIARRRDCSKRSRLLLRSLLFNNTPLYIHNWVKLSDRL